MDQIILTIYAQFKFPVYINLILSSRLKIDYIMVHNICSIVLLQFSKDKKQMT